MFQLMELTFATLTFGVVRLLRRRRLATNAFADSICDLAEKIIATGMTKRIVDLLETVEIERENGE